ncbi:hypothetical protein AVEN_120873-1 [Araneus ventricosus]|uniref:Uncharacterized protein n=1 Tax=Araneus ventricosus TaxID=182803 RepID=A0A4Y2K3D7_ARAVE|nr:hypothetical protein AVEN_120873-1 [Araneus ventricosus]
MYAAADNGKLPKGMMVAKTLVVLSKGTIPVRVINLSDKPKVIKKGEVLAKCAPVTCIERSPYLTSNQSFECLRREFLNNTELNDEQKRATERVIEKLKDVFSRTSDDVRRTNIG